MELPSAASEAAGFASSTVATTCRRTGSIRATLAPAVATQAPAPVSAIAPGSRGTGIVLLTWFVAGLIRDTVASCRFTTQTPDAPAATATGRLPTRIGTKVRLRGSTRNSVPVSSLVTQTAPAPVAIAVGGTPRGTVIGGPSARSRVTVWSTAEPTQTASSPAASALGAFTPSMRWVTLLETGLICATVPSPRSATQSAPSPNANATGSDPTGIVTTRSPLGSMRETVSSLPSATQTESAPAASARGSRPTRY